MSINSMDYVSVVARASGIYAQALHEYSIENTKLERENTKLEHENEKLRELVSLMDKRDVLLPCWRGCDAFCRFYGSHCERIGTLMGELGFEC